MAQDKPTRRSHVVPRAYLQGFADGKNQLTCLRRDKSSQYALSTSDASVIRDFYALPGHPVRIDAFEQTLGRFEAEFPKWRAQLENRQVLSGVDRLTMAGFLAFQVLRGKAFFDAASATEQNDVPRIVAQLSPLEMQDWLLHQGHHFSIDGAIEVQRCILNGEIELELGSTAFVQHIDREVSAVQGHLVARKWQFVNFAEDRLFTCDEPISLLLNNAARSTDVYLALQDNVEILMPISRSVGLRILGVYGDDLLGTGNGDHDEIFEGFHDESKLFNNAMRTQAKSVLFAHPNDHALLYFNESQTSAT